MLQARLRWSELLSGTWASFVVSTTSRLHPVRHHKVAPGKNFPKQLSSPWASLLRQPFGGLRMLQYALISFPGQSLEPGFDKALSGTQP